MKILKAPQEKKSPSIGKMYQADVPPFTGKCNDLLQLANRPIDSDSLSSPAKTWTDLEQESLLLGLYIFEEKNYVLLKRFIGTNKDRVDIQRFYYGNEFYRTEERLRWRRYKRSKRRKSCTPEEKILSNCILGENIFQGSRLEKFMSRLFSLVSEDLHDALIQIRTNFTGGTLPFLDYIFTLRNIVGVSALVKAVGIGQGRHDLTVNYLTYAEITKLLKGNLSESQKTELFRKAVWRHLLTRGWHSEQIKHHRTLRLKQSFVFLVNGVHVFSAGLVKCQDYFDSVIDVMNEVASEPTILGSGRMRAAKQSQEKFPVVDTSMFDEAGQPKLQEIRNLPAESTCLNNPSTLSVENAENVSENSEGNAEESKTSSSEEKISENRTCDDSYNCVASSLDTNESPVPLDENNHEGSSTSPAMKHLISRKDSRVENISVKRDKVEEDSTFQSKSPNAYENMKVQTCSKNSSAVSSLGKGGCPIGSDGSIVGSARSDGEVSSVESPPQKYLFDLNIPLISQDLGTDTDMTQNRDGSCGKGILIDLNAPYVSPDLGIETGVRQNSDGLCEKGILIDLNIPYTDMHKSSSPSEETTDQLPQLLKLPNNVANEDNQPVRDGRRKSTRS